MNATPRYSKQEEYSLDTSDNNNASTDGSDDTIVCVGGGGNSKITVKYGVVTLTLRSC